MIRALRVRHCIMVTVLAAVLPSVFLSGLAFRQDPALSESVPASLLESNPGSRQNLSPLGDDALFEVAGVPFSGRLWLDAALPPRLFAELAPLPGHSLDKPDVLVYYTEPARAGAKPLAEGRASFLGSLGGGPSRCFALPVTAGGSGELIFYSLAHGEELAGGWVLPPRK